MKRIVWLLGLALGLALSPQANAQVRNALVVASCPGSSIWTAGANAPLTVDLTGALCADVTVSATVTFQDFDAAFPSAGLAIGLNDGTNLKSWQAAIALGDGVNGNNTGAVAPWLWNGTGYDRWYGDKTDGAWVNVKAIAAGTNVIGHTSSDPCAQATKINVPISMTGTTTVKLVSLASSQQIYVCSLSLIASGATVVSIADGTKTTTECDTAAEAVIGATTATHGLSLAANGGFTYGNGGSTVARTTTAAHDLCLFQSGAGDVSGNLTYVQQ